MSDINLIEAAQDALFAALVPLEQDATLTALLGTPVQVFQHVPENAQPPMIVLGHIASKPTGSKYDETEHVSAEVQYVFRGAERAKLLAMMKAGRLLITAGLTAAGVAFETPEWMGDEAGDAIADGVTYVGINNFEFHAEPE